jgi:capsular polysaccharide transport system permease protein
LEPKPPLEVQAEAHAQGQTQPVDARLRVKPPLARRLLRRIDGLFAAFVIVPTLLAIAYGVVASDVYISESRFVVRSPQRQMQTGLGALLQGTAFSRSQDDTYSVHDYIKSRDALGELDAKLQLRKRLSAQHIDFINRFPGLTWWHDSFEAFHQHYQKHVVIDYDSVSSISTLRVRAYVAEDAQQVSEQLLQMSERLVNNLNTRSRQDLIEVAEREVRQAEERSKSAAASLAGFRADRGVFDPTAKARCSSRAWRGCKKSCWRRAPSLPRCARWRPTTPRSPRWSSVW